MILRVPNKLLREVETEKGLAFLVSITQHMIGEMRRPLSILVESEKLQPETLQMLLARGARQIQQ